MAEEYLYRYTTIYEFYNYNNHPDHQYKVELEAYVIIKRTTCGAWIKISKKRKKFVNLFVYKKWACETIEEAKESFQARKKSYIIILDRLKKEAELGLELFNNNKLSEKVDTIHYRDGSCSNNHDSWLECGYGFKYWE